MPIKTKGLSFNSGLAFDNVRDKRLSEIWLDSEAFQAFRGTDWMREPCRSCELREIDWGGCRCQAFAMAGAAAEADPACDKSRFHVAFAGLAESESVAPVPAFVYRRPGGAGRVDTRIDRSGGQRLQPAQGTCLNSQ